MIFRALLVCLGILCGAASGQLVKLPAPPATDPAGYALILEFEVGGGRAYYERFLVRPEWPGAASGVTVGIGYDCGYNSRGVILEDWRSLPVPVPSRLAQTSGFIGRSARAILPGVRDIFVPWPIAEDVFNHVSVAKFWQLCRRTWGPGFDELHPRAQWALLSLTFNRGSSMSGESRTEMRTIRDLVPRRDYNGMARELRRMTRVWIGRDIYHAMVRRREAEADLMQSRSGG